MNKGVRPAAIAKFRELLPSRVNTREGNTAFRKSVIAHLEEEFGITHAAGATHYNHAFIEARKAAAADAALATLLVGLGRPEDKKGGRKPKAKPATTPSVIPTPVNVLLQNFIAAGVVQGPQTPAPAAAPAAVEGGSTEASGEQPVQEAKFASTVDNGDPNYGSTTAPTLHSVRKVADGSIVAEGLTLEQANELIEKAAKAKKSKLELVA